MPIDSGTCDFDAGMVRAFDKLVSGEGYPWKLREILPAVLIAGEDAGSLTPEGALLLDPSGDLEQHPCQDRKRQCRNVCLQYDCSGKANVQSLSGN